MMRSKITESMLSVRSAECTSATRREYEVFLSFDKSVEDKVQRLYSMLSETFDMTVFLDNPGIDYTMKPKYKKLIRNLLRSKLIVFCINRDFINSRKCKDKVIIAYTNSKQMLFLMFQNLSSKDLGPIVFAFEGAPKVNMYEAINTRNPFHGGVIADIHLTIQNILGREITINRLNEKRRAVYLPFDSLNTASTNGQSLLKKEDEEPQAVISIKEGHDNELEDEFSRHEDPNVFRFERSQSICSLNQDSQFLDPGKINLKLSKYNPLFEYAYGYNRMAYLESKKRYLLTSSYHKTIVCIDKSGNWIEKRNPGGVLKQPFAICVSSRNEVYVGDNELKCIFLFDDNLKLLRTFAGNIVGGFTDIVIDNESQELYTVHIYDSLVVTISIKESVVTSKFHVSAPTFIRLFSQAIAVLTTDELIYIVDKQTHELRYKIELKNSKFSSALCTYRDDTIFVTAYEFRFNRTKSKNVFLCVVKIKDADSSVQIKKIDIDIHQVNDMILTKNSLTCIDDTHFTMFKFDDIDKLLEWEEDLYEEGEY